MDADTAAVDGGGRPTRLKLRLRLRPKPTDLPTPATPHTRDVAEDAVDDEDAAESSSFLLLLC